MPVKEKKTLGFLEIFFEEFLKGRWIRGMTEKI